MLASKRSPVVTKQAIGRQCIYMRWRCACFCSDVHTSNSHCAQCDIYVHVYLYVCLRTPCTRDGNVNKHQTHTHVTI